MKRGCCLYVKIVADGSCDSLRPSIKGQVINNITLTRTVRGLVVAQSSMVTAIIGFIIMKMSSLSGKPRERH